jgi:hypothetical protein
MNDWYGNLTDGQSVRMTFNSYLFATGASTTVTDLIASGVLVSKDGVSQSTQGAGITVEIDKNATGAHFITIDTSDTTDADFYEAGADYQVEFIGATIDSATVNSVVGSFSIENRSDEVDLAKILGTALTETPGQLAAAFKKLFNVAVPTLVASDVMRGTDGVDTATMVGTDDAALASVLGSAVGASISADIAAIPTTMVGTDDAALASVLGSAVGASISADIAAIPTTMVGTDNAATETKQDAGDVVTARIAAIQEADRIIDFPNGTLTYNEKGTSNALLTKDLLDPDDAAVNSTEDVIAAEENV